MHPSAAAPAPRVVHRFFECSLLGMLAAGYGAVVASGYLDAAATVLGLLGLVVRALMLAEPAVADAVAFALPPRMMAALAIGYLGFFPLDYYYVSGNFLAATVHMVFFLAVLKLLTARTPRDYGYLKAIAALELIAAAILSSGYSFLVFLAIFLLFAIAAFASGEVRRAAIASGAVSPAVSRSGLRAFSRRLSVLSVFLFAGILLLTAGLFLVLPRTAQAAFERFAPRRNSLTGFSNNVTLGEIGRIKQSGVRRHARAFLSGRRLPAREVARCCAGRV